jgi:hypothetical protein
MTAATQWEQAKEMAEYGWNIIPLNDGRGTAKDKVPLVKWRDYQEDPAQEVQIDYWQNKFPTALIGAITGAASGFVVVDCDNDDAIAYAKEKGVWSPVRVRTRRGLHLFFRHPRGDRRFGPRVGSNSTGYDWPKFAGLDFRGDGSYVAAFTSPGYRLDVDEGYSIFELDDMPEWEGWPMDAPVSDLSTLDLTSARVLTEFTEWERTAAYIGNHYPGAKIPTGASNGRNERVARWAGECAAMGLYGEALEQRVVAFMDAFYMDRLDQEEYKATCQSVEAAERRNHPERVAKHEAEMAAAAAPAESVSEPAPATAPAAKLSLLRLSDAPAMAIAAAATPMLISPFLPVGGICHVSGYTGHGKSMVISHILVAAAAGVPFIGPFEIPRPIRVLYMDYENGRGTLAKRFTSMLRAYGDPGERLGVWTPWLENDDLPMFDNAALKKFGAIIKEQKPDVVVIDTARSAYPGLSENDAEAWAPINRLMKRLQGYGIASILIHHKNKPQNGGSFSREAGSTAQLNVVETQFYVTQVYKDKARADAVAGIHDDGEDPIWPKMERKAEADLGIDFTPTAIFEMRYGKVRDWSELHDPVQWMALCANLRTGDEMMIGSSSTRQRARMLYSAGKTDIDVAKTLGINLFLIREWLGLL